VAGVNSNGETYQPKGYALVFHTRDTTILISIPSAGAIKKAHFQKRSGR